MHEEFDEVDLNARINFKLWKRVLSYLKPYKKLIIIMMVAVISTALVETLFVKYISEDGLKRFVEQGNLDGFALFLLGMLGFVLAEGIAVKVFIMASSRIEQKIYSLLTSEAFSHLQSLSYSFFDKYSVGWLISRTTNDTARLGEILSWGINDLIWSIFKLIFILIVMLTISPKLALIMLIVVPTITLVGVFFRKVIIRYSWKVRRLNAQVSGALNEGIMGAKTSKSLVLEEKNFHGFSQIVHKFRSASIRSSIYNSLYYQIIAVIAAFGIASMTYFGGMEVLIGPMESSVLFLFISYTTMFFEPVLGIARITNEMKHAQVAAERVFNIISVEPELIDRPEVLEKYGTYNAPKKDNWEALDGTVTFDHVSFGYNGGANLVLKDFSLDVEKGKSVALVGETGAGKSTIVNLLCRFYEPTAGSIRIDGRDYKERSIAWLHANLGYVMQTPHLFSGTVKDNIAYGKLDATLEEVIEAAKAVNAHDFIMKLDHGYDSEVGEGGNRLSQGQRQLLSFARAIIANPKILVLDEATSSIDTETEYIIQQAIHHLLAGRTSFIIAHRLSTIVHSDLILVVKAGEVIERGTHEELMQVKGYYYKLYTNQFVENQMKELHFM